MTESFVYRLLQDYGNHRKGAEIAVYSEGEKVALENPEIAEKIPFEEAEIPRSILKILKTPDFLDKCVAEVGKRVAGEMPTIKAIGLFSAGRLVQNCEASSFNFALNDESGLGKDYVSGKTLSLFVPEPLFIYRSRISPTALTYMHDSRREPEWSWDGKVLFLEDVGENVLNAEVLKTFLTGGSFATVVIRQRAEDIKIQGKPVIGCTFANSAMKNETVRRLQLIRMDGSAEQTLRIKTFKKKIAQIGKNEEYDADILTAIATLKRVSVVIPELITRSLDAFPDVSIVRTNSGRFFDLIRASTAFHQFQRAKNSDGFVIAATQDYELAAEIFCNLVGSRNMTPLTRNQQKLIEVIRDMVQNSENQKAFSAQEILDRQSFLSKPSVYANLDALADVGYLLKGIESRNTSGSENFTRIIEVAVYSIKKQVGFSLPSYTELGSISNAKDV